MKTQNLGRPFHKLRRCNTTSPFIGCPTQVSVNPCASSFSVSTSLLDNQTSPSTQLALLMSAIGLKKKMDMQIPFKLHFQFFQLIVRHQIG